MSIWIPDQNGTNLSQVQVGNTGEIPIPAAIRPAAVSKLKPKIVFNNESGCGLAVQMQGSNRQVFLPAGAWTEPLDLEPQDSSIHYYVSYVLPNAPVTNLYIVIFAANEQPMRITALGNSPIGISGSVQTSNVQSLTNDGSVAETTVIEMTPVDQTQSSVLIRNTASGYLQVLSAGFLRTIVNIVRGNSGATKAQIQFGDSADATITTFYGSLQGSQDASVGTLTSTRIVSDGGVISSNGSGQLSVGVLIFGAANIGQELYQVDLDSSHSAIVYDILDRRSGRQSGHIFQTWDGTNPHNLLSIGGDLGVSTNWIQADGVAALAVYDNSLSTIRATRRFLGTADPTTYTTVNEGDEWDAV